MRHALVVDNNEFYRRVLCEFLGAEGFRVSAAEDGRAALDSLARERPDLLILDLIMPKVDGAQVCRRVKSNSRMKDIPVIILSGVLVEDLGNLETIGANAFVAKMPLDRLLPTLRNVIRRLDEGCDGPVVDGFEGMYRREIVSELLEEKRFRDRIFSSLSEGAAELDPDLRILRVNPAFAALVDRDELEVINQPIDQVLGLGSGARQAVFGPLGRRAEGRPRSGTVKLGDREMRFRASPVLLGSEINGYMVLIEDLSPVLEAERERVELRRQLAQTEKLAALGQFVAGMAHELNNPLTGVLGYAQLALERGPAERARRDLERILQEAKRCRVIVEKLLAFSRSAASERRPTDISELTLSTVDAFRQELEGQGIEVRVEIDPGLPSIPVDAHQIRQVLFQLIQNGRQAISVGNRGGHLTVSCRRWEDGMRVEVQDNGVGIAERNLPRVFDPFFTTADVGEGAGLGLSVAYGIVREHGGRILVASRLGEGSTFTVELPLQPAVAEGGAVLDKRQEGETPCVLVVDDEPVILELLGDLLDSQGVQVETASNGVEALDRLEERSYDAIVLDLKMPEMDGREVYERLKETNPAILPRILFSTGDMISPETRRFFDQTAAPVIQKPFRISQVTQVLSRFLSRC